LLIQTPRSIDARLVALRLPAISLLGILMVPRVPAVSRNGL